MTTPENPSPRTAIVATLPFICIHQANLMDQLHRRYARVVTVPSVRDELARRRKTNVYTPVLESFPWVEVIDSPEHDHIGEPEFSELLALARVAENPLLIVEARHERKVCDRQRIPSTGVMGLVLMLKKLGMVESVRGRIPLLCEAGLGLSKRSISLALLMAGEA